MPIFVLLGSLAREDGDEILERQPLDWLRLWGFFPRQFKHFQLLAGACNSLECAIISEKLLIHLFVVTRFSLEKKRRRLACTRRTSSLLRGSFTHLIG